MRKSRSTPGSSAQAAIAGVERTQPKTLMMTILMTTWVFVLFEPDVWLATQGLHIVKQATLLLYIVLLGGVLFLAPGRQPALLVAAFVFPPLLNLPFVDSQGLVRDIVVKILGMHYILLSATFTFVRSARPIDKLVLMFTAQFGLWGMLGSFTGGEASVRWHPELGNSDAFGPLMTMGAGYCYFVAMAMPRSKWRTVTFLVAGLCVIGTITSFARGAFLVLLMTGGLVWLRSPHKLRTAAAAVGGAIIVAISASIFFPGGAFWKEMGTIQEQGTTEGTGRDRVELWIMAMEEFRHRPILGVGAGNFGRYAYLRLSDAELGSYAANREWIFGRALHNIYFEILSEYGAVGTLAFLGLLFDFWRRNIRLRRPSVVRRWNETSGSQFDLRPLSLGLECAMVAFLGNGVFYNLMYIHWFWTVLALNYVLYLVAVDGRAKPRQVSHSRQRRLSTPPAGVATVTPA